MVNLAWLIPVFPLVGFVLNGLGRNVFPKFVISALASLMVMLSFAISVGIFLEFEGTEAVIVPIFDWIKVGNLTIPFSFQIDQLSILMLLIITGIGSLIHIYSAGYMSHDAGFGKFFAYLNLFIFFMLLLVLGSNFLHFRKFLYFLLIY